MSCFDDGQYTNDQGEQCPNCADGTVTISEDGYACDSCDFSSKNADSVTIKDEAFFVAGVKTDIGTGNMPYIGAPKVYSSAVHFQRHSACYVEIGCTKDDDKTPYRVTVAQCDSRWLLRRDVNVFDCFVDLGLEPNIVNERERGMFERHALSYSTFLDVFDDWVAKCNLGMSAVQAERKFLPMYMTFEQFEKAKEVWSHGILEEWAVHPYRVLESIIASNNDRLDMQARKVECGKNTVSQFCAKYGFVIPRGASGPLRLDSIAKAYNAYLLTR